MMKVPAERAISSFMRLLVIRVAVKFIAIHRIGMACGVRIATARLRENGFQFYHPMKLIVRRDEQDRKLVTLAGTGASGEASAFC